jgi:hypothetical protein
MIICNWRCTVQFRTEIDRSTRQWSSECRVSFNAVIAPGYDGARVINSHNAGTNAVIKETCPFADYDHCSLTCIIEFTLSSSFKAYCYEKYDWCCKRSYPTKFLSTSNKKHHYAEQLRWALKFLLGWLFFQKLWVEWITSLENFLPVMLLLHGIWQAVLV